MGLPCPRCCDRIIHVKPLWRNWQTRWTQNPVVAISCRFDPGQRHQKRPEGEIPKVFFYGFGGCDRR